MLIKILVSMMHFLVAAMNYCNTAVDSHCHTEVMQAKRVA